MIDYEALIWKPNELYKNCQAWKKNSGTKTNNKNIDGANNIVIYMCQSTPLSGINMLCYIDLFFFSLHLHTLSVCMCNVYVDLTRPQLPA